MINGVSVIIPFYDEIELIDRAVSSVTMNLDKVTDFEILICNDGTVPCSTIQKILATYTKFDIRIIRNFHLQGPGGARNTGLVNAKYDVFAFLDADDYWLPGKMKSQLAHVQDGFNFITTGYSLNERVVITPPKLITSPFEIFTKRGIGTSCVCVTRNLVNGNYFSDLRFCQDIDFWYKLAREDLFAYSAVSDPYVVYSTGGTTKNKFKQLYHMNKMLNSNDIPCQHKLSILLNYSFYGVLNHYLR